METTTTSTCKCNLRKWQHRWDDVGKHGGEVSDRQLGIAEQQQVEDDAAHVEGDQGDEDLQKRPLQIHVVAQEDHDGEDVAWQQKN